MDVTNVSDSVPRAGTRAAIGVFDVKGRLVRRLIDRGHDAGRHSIMWDGADDRGRPVPSGIYFLRIEIGDHFKQAKKMILGR